MTETFVFDPANPEHAIKTNLHVLVSPSGTRYSIEKRVSRAAGFIEYVLVSDGGRHLRKSEYDLEGWTVESAY